MRARARDLGVKLRPHLKTAKSFDVAGLATDADDPRITVSTLREAEYFAAAGFGDILYAVGMALRILPNHACATASQHDAYLVVDGALPEVVARWPRINGW